jgi:hypothetical protein
MFVNLLTKLTIRPKTPSNSPPKSSPKSPGKSPGKSPRKSPRKENDKNLEDRITQLEQMCSSFKEQIFSNSTKRTSELDNFSVPRKVRLLIKINKNHKFRRKRETRQIVQ